MRSEHGLLSLFGNSVSVYSAMLGPQWYMVCVTEFAADFPVVVQKPFPVVQTGCRTKQIPLLLDRVIDNPVAQVVQVVVFLVVVVVQLPRWWSRRAEYCVPTVAFSDMLVTCPLLSTTGAWAWTVPKNCGGSAVAVFRWSSISLSWCRGRFPMVLATIEFPQLRVDTVVDAPSVQFLEVIDTPVVLVTTSACVSPDSADIHRDFTCAVLDKAVGMPLVCRNCGGSAVTVYRQVWFTCLLLHSDRCRWSRQCSLVLRRGQLIFSMMNFGYFYGPCTQVQGRGSCPQGHGPHLLACIDKDMRQVIRPHHHLQPSHASVPIFPLCHLYRDDGQRAARHGCCPATTRATTACHAEA